MDQSQLPTTPQIRYNSAAPPSANLPSIPTANQHHAQQTDISPGGGGSQQFASADERDDDDDEAMSEWGLTKAGKKRQRLPLACQACRKRKIRCSGDKGGCVQCAKHNRQCIYDPLTHSRGRPSGRRDGLDSPAGEGYNMFAQGTSPNVPMPIPTMGAPVLNRQAPATHSMMLPPPNVVPPSAFTPQDWMDVEYLGASKLYPPPRKDILLHLISLYFSRLYNQTYGFLHRPTFMKKVEEGRAPPALLYALCAVAARFSDHPEIAKPEILPYERGEVFAIRAREMALADFDKSIVCNVQAMVTLALHDFGARKGSKAWMFAGMAMRVAHALRLNREHDDWPMGNAPSGGPGWIEREVRRKTYWSCFIIDRLNSAGMERPHQLQEVDSRVQLPADERSFTFGTAVLTEPLDRRTSGIPLTQDMKSNLGATAYMIRIVAFWGRVTTYVNSSTTPSLWSNVANKKRIAPWLPQSEFSTLVADLKSWHDDLPAWLKYTPENLAAHVSINAAPPYVFMHIAYHTVLCTLHRFSVPSNSAPGAKGGPSAALGTGPAVAAGEEAPPAEFVASSVASCFYHARRISLIMTDLRARADECQITAPFVGFAIFTASLFHLHKAYASSPGTSAEAVEEAKRFLALGVEVLDQLRKWWGPLEGLFLALSNLVKAQTAGPSPMVGMQGFTPSGPPRSAGGLDLTGASARNTPVVPVASGNSTLGVVGLSKAPTPQPGGAQQQWDPTSMIQMASNLEGFGYREGSPSNDFSFLDMMFAEGANASNFASMPGSPRMGGPFSANPTRPGSPRTQQQPTMQNSFNMPFPGAIADPMRASPGASVAAVAPASSAKPSYTRYESTPAVTPVPAAGNGSALPTSETAPRSVDGFLPPLSPRAAQAKALSGTGTGTGTAPHSPVLTTDGLQHPTPSHSVVQTGPGLADEALGKDADAADLLVYFQKQCSGAASSGATPVPAAVENGVVGAVGAGTKRTADGQPKTSDGGPSRADISHLLDAGRQ